MKFLHLTKCWLFHVTNDETHVDIHIPFDNRGTGDTVFDGVAHWGICIKLIDLIVIIFARVLLFVDENGRLVAIVARQHRPTSTIFLKDFKRSHIHPLTQTSLADGRRDHQIKKQLEMNSNIIQCSNVRLFFSQVAFDGKNPNLPSSSFCCAPYFSSLFQLSLHLP